MKLFCDKDRCKFNILVAYVAMSYYVFLLLRYSESIFHVVRRVYWLILANVWRLSHTAQL